MNSRDIYNSKRQISSKQIELKFESTDSFSDNTQKYKISISKSSYSPYSLLTKNLPSDSKYFSDSAIDKSDILSNTFLGKLKRFLIIYKYAIESNLN